MEGLVDIVCLDRQGYVQFQEGQARLDLQCGLGVLLRFRFYMAHAFRILTVFIEWSFIEDLGKVSVNYALLSPVSALFCRNIRARHIDQLKIWYILLSRYYRVTWSKISAELLRVLHPNLVLRGILGCKLVTSIRVRWSVFRAPDCVKVFILKVKQSGLAGNFSVIL